MDSAGGQAQNSILSDYQGLVALTFFFYLWQKVYFGRVALFNKENGILPGIILPSLQNFCLDFSPVSPSESSAFLADVQKQETVHMPHRNLIFAQLQVRNSQLIHQRTREYRIFIVKLLFLYLKFHQGSVRGRYFGVNKKCVFFKTTPPPKKNSPQPYKISGLCAKIKHVFHALKV